MSNKKKKPKSIKKAMDEQDLKLTNYLQARLSMEEYHEAMEHVNVLIDLTMHAFMLSIEQNKKAFEDAGVLHPSQTPDKLAQIAPSSDGDSGD